LQPKPVVGRLLVPGLEQQIEHLPVLMLAPQLQHRIDLEHILVHPNPVQSPGVQKLGFQHM